MLPKRTLTKKRQEVEVRFCGRKGERVDREVGGFKPHPEVATAKQTRQAFKTPAQIENEGERVVLLQIRD